MGGYHTMIFDYRIYIQSWCKSYQSCSPYFSLSLSLSFSLYLSLIPFPSISFLLCCADKQIIIPHHNKLHNTTLTTLHCTPVLHCTVLYCTVLCYTGLSRYVGVDIAVDSLKHFVDERLLMDSISDIQRQKVSHLISADMGKQSLISSILDTHTWIQDPHSRLGEIKSHWEQRWNLKQHYFDWYCCDANAQKIYLLD